MLQELQAEFRAHARAVTQDEIDFYRKNGWVHLKALIPEAEAAAILREIDRQRGGGRPGFAHGDMFSAMWENVPDPSRQSPALRAFTHGRELGDAAAALQGGAVRYWRDEVLLKMPADRRGGETPWHQDHPYTAFDRSGRPQFWIALMDIPPERGSLVFLSGSHKSGVLGRAFHDDSDAMKNRIASVRAEYPQSPPLHLRPGDATVHDGMTIHSAPPNVTSDPRWAYVVQFFVADALYNGAPSPVIEGLGLEVNMPFSDERFPIVGWPPNARA